MGEEEAEIIPRAVEARVALDRLAERHLGVGRLAGFGKGEGGAVGGRGIVGLELRGAEEGGGGGLGGTLSVVHETEGLVDAGRMGVPLGGELHGLLGGGVLTTVREILAEAELAAGLVERQGEVGVEFAARRGVGGQLG